MRCCSISPCWACTMHAYPSILGGHIPFIYTSPKYAIGVLWVWLSGKPLCCAPLLRYSTSLHDSPGKSMAIKCCLYNRAACVAGSAAAAAVCWYCPGSVVQSMHRQRHEFMQMQAQPVNQNRQCNLKMPNTTAQSCVFVRLLHTAAAGMASPAAFAHPQGATAALHKNPLLLHGKTVHCAQCMPVWLLALRSHRCSCILCRILQCALPVMRICLCCSPCCQDLQCSHLFGSSSNLRCACPCLHRSSISGSSISGSAW